MATDPPEVEGQLPAPVARVSSNPVAAVDRHRLLWRDSATILIGVVLAILVAQSLAPATDIVATGSPTPAPSAVDIGTALPQLSLGPGETFGPIIDPSLGIDATPTPIPVITLGPSPSPSPSPSPTPKPTGTPKPTPKPTPRPTGTPAPPVASFSWNQTGDLTFDFSNSSTGDTSWAWDFGDGGTSSVQNPTHTFDAAATCTVNGSCTVQLVVTGPAGTDSVSHNVGIAPLPTPTP